MMDRRILLAQNGEPEPEPALVFSAPLASLASVATTGQELSYHGNPEPTVKDGIPCLYLDGSSCVWTEDMADMSSGRRPCTVSVWCWHPVSSGGDMFISFFGSGASRLWMHMLFAGNGKNLKYGHPDRNIAGMTGDVPVGQWTHFATVYDGNGYALYVDGVEKSTLSYTAGGHFPAILVFGAKDSRSSASAPPSFADMLRQGYIANAKVYNFALSSSEIADLADELHPAPEIKISTRSVAFFYGTAGTATVRTVPSGCTFSLSGTLPSSVTFNASSGTFSYTGAATGEGTCDVFVTASKQGYTATSAQIQVILFASSEMPEDGLVFHAPLSSVAAKSNPTQETWNDDESFLSGYPLSYLKRISSSQTEQSYPTATTKDGVPCLYITDDRYISVPDMHWNSWTSGKGITVSLWVQFTIVGGRREIGIFGDCTPSSYSDNWQMYLDRSDGHVVFCFASWTRGAIKSGFIPVAGRWYNISVCLSSDHRTQSLYVDGILIDMGTANDSSTGNDPMCIGRNNDLPRGDHCIYGYMAGFRIYNRALSAAELLLLTHEFTPQGGTQ